MHSSTKSLPLGLTSALSFSVLFGCTWVCAADKPAADKPAPTTVATPTNPNPVNKDELRSKLTPLQYDVTCNAATEPAFRNAYWDNHAEGLYIDVTDGEPLFASNHKFDSGTGWPSFFQPVRKESVIEKEDRSHGMIRVEVISAKSGAHLGHLFPDGPRPTGMRYCINSASLRFIPVADLEKEGYGKLRSLFQTTASETPGSDPAKK
jgi:methionine-R-sulfoxide reductase